jgi:nitric oxide reductase NorQ protein
MSHREQFLVKVEPFYQAQGREVELYAAAYAARLPVMLKGPTGCGKSRFVEYMAWTLGKPLITVACNEDMTASDLVGRYLLDANGTRWLDGPLTTAARIGAICYLDEIVISYNPGYQSLMKDLKQSTKQRFTAFDFDYPEAALETQIVAQESGLDAAAAATLVKIAQTARNLKGHGLDEGISTRLIVYAATLIKRGVAPQDACRMAMVRPITDDADIRATLDHAVDASFA